MHDDDQHARPAWWGPGARRVLVGAGLAGAALGAPGVSAAADADGVTLFMADAVRPQVVWAMAVGETDAAPDEVDGIAIDARGDTVITGVFREGLRLGGQTLTSRGEGDMYVAKVDPAGQVLWVRQFGADGDDTALDLAGDPTGAVFANGWFDGAVDFGGVTLTSAGQADHVLLALEPDGRTRWAQSFGGADGDGGQDVALDRGGILYASAVSEGAYTAGGLSFPHGGGGRDSYVLKVAQDGRVLWVLPIDGGGSDLIGAIAVDGLGHAYGGFQFRGDLRIGDHVLTSRGDWDGAIAKFSPEGHLLGLVQVGGPGADAVRGLGADSSGNVYATGFFSDLARIADREAQAVGEHPDDYVIKIRPDGSTAWLTVLAGPGRSQGPEVRANDLGAMVSTLVDGAVTLTVDGHAAGVIAPPGDRPTSALVAINADGRPVWAYTPTAGVSAVGGALAVSPDSRHVAQALRFRGTLAVAGQTMTTPGERDSAVILLRIAP